MESFKFSDLFFFERTIAPLLIKVLFWLGVAGIAVGFLGSLGWGAGMGQTAGGGVGFMAILAGALWAVLSFLLWRVFCEMLIIVFNMHDRLGHICKRLDEQQEGGRDDR